MSPVNRTVLEFDELILDVVEIHDVPHLRVLLRDTGSTRPAVGHAMDLQAATHLAAAILRIASELLVAEQEASTARTRSQR